MPHSQWHDFLQANKGQGLNVSEIAAMYRLQNPNAKRSRGPSRCAGVSQDKCLPPKCKYVAGPKRQYCRAASTRGRVPSRCAGMNQQQCAQAGCSWRKATTYVNSKGNTVTRKAHCVGPRHMKKGAKSGSPKKAASKHNVPRAVGQTAAQFAAYCKGLPQNECKQTPACNWQGGKRQRCVRGHGAKAVAAMHATKGAAGKWQNKAGAAEWQELQPEQAWEAVPPRTYADVVAGLQ